MYFPDFFFGCFVWLVIGALRLQLHPLIEIVIQFLGFGCWMSDVGCWHDLTYVPEIRAASVILSASRVCRRPHPRLGAGQSSHLTPPLTELLSGMWTI